MNATTLATVKDWMGSESSGHDTELNLLIPAVSRALEGPQYLNRKLEKVERVEEYWVDRADVKRLTLNESPIDTTATFEIKESEQKDWDNVSVITATDYNVFSGLQEGYIKWRDGYYPVGPTCLQVTYTAGFDTSEANLLTSYPDIVQAANMWVLELYRRRDSVGKQTMNYPNRGGTATFLPPPPAPVRELLRPYIRRSFGNG